MKTTEKMIKVMQAYTEGKEIEVRLLGCKEERWEDCTNPKWNWHFCDYRIKKEPSYRPYNCVDEMLDDFCERCRKQGMTVSRSPMGEPFIWLLHKGSETLRLATAYCREQGGIKLYDSCLQTFQDLFDNYTYKDGSPCGKKVEE